MLEVLRLAVWIQSLIRESVCDLPTIINLRVAHNLTYNLSTEGWPVKTSSNRRLTSDWWWRSLDWRLKVRLGLAGKTSSSSSGWPSFFLHAYGSPTRYSQSYLYLNLQEPRLIGCEPKVKYEDVSHHSIEDWRPTIIHFLNHNQPKVGNNGWAGGWVLMSWVSN